MIRCNVSLVSIFIIPDLLLLTTYFYGIYLFWSGHEYLQNLAGQVGVAGAAVLLHTLTIGVHTLLQVYIMARACTSSLDQHHLVSVTGSYDV